jgi:hypothetical protein
VYLHVNKVDPLAARLTRDIDAVIKRTDIKAIAQVVKPFGLEFRHLASMDMLVDAQEPGARSAMHFIFVNEKVRQEYVEPVPDFSAAPMIDGLLIAPVADLVRMKLTSFRDKDRVHIRDMDSVGLITNDIEANISEPPRLRLAQIRASSRQNPPAQSRSSGPIAGKATLPPRTLVLRRAVDILQRLL